MSAISLLPAIAWDFPMLVPNYSQMSLGGVCVRPLLCWYCAICVQGVIILFLPIHLMCWPYFKMTAIVALLISTEEL